MALLRSCCLDKDHPVLPIQILDTHPEEFPFAPYSCVAHQDDDVPEKVTSAWVQVASQGSHHALFGPVLATHRNRARQAQLHLAGFSLLIVRFARTMSVYVRRIGREQFSPHQQVTCPDFLPNPSSVTITKEQEY